MSVKWFEFVGFDVAYGEKTKDPYVVLLLKKKNSGDTAGIKMPLAQAMEFLNDLEDKIRAINTDTMSGMDEDSGLILPH